MLLSKVTWWKQHFQPSGLAPKIRMHHSSGTRWWGSEPTWLRWNGQERGSRGIYLLNSFHKYVWNFARCSLLDGECDTVPVLSGLRINRGGRPGKGRLTDTPAKMALSVDEHLVGSHSENVIYTSWNNNKMPKYKQKNQSSQNITSCVSWEILIFIASLSHGKV